MSAMDTVYTLAPYAFVFTLVWLAGLETANAPRGNFLQPDRALFAAQDRV